MLSEFLNPLIGYLSDLIVKFGYAGIFAVTFIENIIAPIPSEFLFPWAGFLASKGDLNIFLIAFSGALGSLVAALVLYYLGHKMSGDKSRKFVAKYGKYLFIKEEDIERAENWFKDYGVWTVFLFRLVPLGRTIISIPAGFIKMNVWTFSLLTFAGTFIWCFILTYLGFVLGENWEVIAEYSSEYEKVVILLIIITGVSFVYWKRKEILNTIKNISSKI
jgi:membrane protein DedA with SNARE-associated domain